MKIKKKRRDYVTTHRRERYQIREGRSTNIPQPIRLLCDYDRDVEKPKCWCVICEAVGSCDRSQRSGAMVRRIRDGGLELTN